MVAAFAALALAVPAATAAGTAQGQGPKDKRLWAPGELGATASVGGKKAPRARPAAAPGDGAPHWRPSRADWPDATTAEVRLDPAAKAAEPARAANMPLTLASGSATPAGSAPSASRAPAAGLWAVRAAAPATGKVTLSLADRKAAERAGVDGLLVSLTPREDSARGAARLGLDYTAVKNAYGGDWASRLRLVALPACALTTPDLARCRIQTPVPGAVNDVRAGRLLGEVTLGGGAASPSAPALGAPTLGAAALSAADSGSGGVTVLAASAAPEGSSGDYKATPLSPAGSWSAGGNSGTFRWSYPITLPASLGGTAPSVELSYNSAAVDGRTVTRNSQSSWIGDGWEYEPGFVERAYQGCKQDGKDGTGEACWSSKQPVTLSLNGSSTELVLDDTGKNWRTSDGSPTRVELAKLPAGVSNGDNDGEYWKITTPDGVQYYFGAQAKPGTTSGPNSNSAWTRPVYANNAGEPCYQADFAQSWCQQAWRWNLDYVVDTRGGLVSYSYATESNQYSRNPDAAHPDGTPTPYVRGGQLTQIGYGSKLTDTTGPTARVLFTAAERCDPAIVPKADCAAPPTKATAASWPDVPFDQNCDAGTSAKDCKHYAPTFWSTRRLAKITTQVLTGGSPATVDEWTLAHDYPSPQDGTTPSVWLSSITRTSLDGTASLTLPSVDFTGTLMPNRVDTAGDSRPPLNRRRMTAVTTESGLRLGIEYAAPDCAAGSFPAPDANTRRCYPVFWNPDPGTTMDPTIDWFHKYVVAGVSETDATSAGADPSPARTTRYEYVGAAAWHRDDGELTEAKSRTWNQFRGYGEVIVRKGGTQANPADKTTQTGTVYLRGMDGDYKADGTRRSVAIPGGQAADSAPLAGFVRESRTYSGDGGTVTATTVNDPWTGPVVARHGRGTGLPDQTAQLTRSTRSTSSALLSDGTWRAMSKTTGFDETTGAATSELDSAAGLPDFCTKKTYASNTALNIIALPVESVSLAGDCSVAPGAGTTTSHTRTLYDGLPFGQIGTVGAATTAQVIDGYDGASPSHTLDTVTEYDAYGRPVKVTDTLGNTSTTGYTPASGALPTRVAVTGPTGWTTTTDLMTARGLPVKTSDINNHVTELAYDAAGRLTGVWQPGRDRAAGQSPNLQFAYDLSKTAPSVVTTRTLRDDGAYRASYQILDAFLKVRQTQEAPVDESPGRILADTFYDSLGRVVKTNQPYWDKTTGPSGSRFLANDTEVPAQTGTFYDGQGRKTAEALSSHAVEQWRTTTVYAGAEKTSTLPPDGGTATTVITDARGKTAQLRQYKDQAQAGSDVAAAFTATSYTYDPRAQLKTVTDAAGNSWSYTYDLLGRQISASDPDKGTGETHYDAVGRVAWTKDARGQVLSTTYDKLSRKTGLYAGPVSDANLLASWSFDRLARGQADGSTRYVGGKTGAAYSSEVTGLDAQYHPLGTKVTIPAAEGKLAGAYTQSVSYTPVTGKPVSVTLPAAGGLPGETITTGLSDNGLPVTLWSEESDYVNRTAYDPFGRARRVTYGDVPKQVAYTPRYEEATGRLAATNLDRQTGPGDTQVTGSVDATTYTYKPSGDITSVATRRDEGAAGFTTDRQCFTYDYLDRMTEAWTDKNNACTTAPPKTSDVGGPAPYWQSYGFDVTGNRTKLVDHDPADATGGRDTVTTYTSPAPGAALPHTVTGTSRSGPAGAASTAYTYDAAGNTLTRPGGQTLAWDQEGHLASNTGSTYLYDAQGSRLLRRDPGKVTLYLGTDELTLTTASGSVSGVRTIPGIAGGPSIVRTPTGLTYEASDHHGTATTSLDASTLAITRRAQKPYGESRGPAPAAWPDDKGFLGKPQDTTGLTHIGAREYDPALGRFISVDPVADLADPQQMHGYTYANANPVTKSDPTGLIYGLPCFETGDCGDPKGGTIGDGGTGDNSVNGCGGQPCPTEPGQGVKLGPYLPQPLAGPKPLPNGTYKVTIVPKGENEFQVLLTETASSYFHYDPNCGLPGAMLRTACSSANMAAPTFAAAADGRIAFYTYAFDSSGKTVPKLLDVVSKGSLVTGALASLITNWQANDCNGTAARVVKTARDTAFDVGYVLGTASVGGRIGALIGTPFGPMGEAVGTGAGTAAGTIYGAITTSWTKNAVNGVIEDSGNWMKDKLEDKLMGMIYHG
ncbi:RHS repeat-associated core domain-containing protein [Streptomyces sp. NPDC059443]|uniref:RHS repeat domain-containing protein n=1 Tax=unclassified Streptomyces TaxID=2593676 RepID=UPI0036A358FD